MFLKMLFALFVVLAPAVQAAQKPVGTIVVVDELLFDLGGEGQTSYDFKIFADVLKSMDRYFSEALKKSFNNESEFYLFSCLALREAEQLDIQADPEVVERFLQNYRFSDNAKKAEATKKEIEKMFRVAELATIKERQLRSRQSITAWLMVLKRKYSLGWKSNDFKSRITFGI